MQYHLIRSNRRKTIALQVKNAQVIVRAPEYVDIEYIENLIQLKSAWLTQKCLQQQTAIDNTKQNVNSNKHGIDSVYVDGVLHSIKVCFGKPQVLHAEAEKLLTIVISNRYRQYETNSTIIINKVKSVIEQWFKASILNYLHHKIPILCQITALHARSFKVRKYKARWGSCNNTGELSFNSLLKMVPLWVVDYVIVHELCHLKYMNHSQPFWQLVEKHDPNFKRAKAWLKTHQAALTWY